MRKKLLNNNLTGAISKGGVLYRTGELPTLTTQQKEQAKLVSKLPNDFPFADWEGMNTKQQLRQMQYSGLNAQEQWSLLNSNVPLAVLNEHNQVQGENETRAYAARVAASLVNPSAQVATAKAQAAVGKPTVSTSLQTTTQQRKLDMKQEEYETRFYEKAAARINDTSKPTNPIKTPTTYKPVDNTQPKDSDEDSGKKDNWVDNLAAIWEDSKRSLFDGLSAFWDSILSPDKDSGLTSTPTRITLETKPPIKTPVITPTPSPIPTPSPKPTPTPTPKLAQRETMLDTGFDFLNEAVNNNVPYCFDTSIHDRYGKGNDPQFDCTGLAIRFLSECGSQLKFDAGYISNNCAGMVKSIRGTDYGKITYDY